LGARLNSRVGRLVVGVLLIGLAACRQIAGIGQRSVSPPPACGIRFSDACDACVEQSCCNEASACAAHSACLALEQCRALANGDPTGRSSCTFNNPVRDPDAFGAATALDTCLASTCADACGLVCGGVSQIQGPVNAGDCQACVAANGCSAAVACATNLDCQSHALCRENCVTGDCVGACNAAYPAGDVLYNAYTNAIGGACATDCRIGNNWTCAGHVTWPTTRADTRVLDVTLTNPEQGPLPAGLTVKLCDAVDTACAVPVGGQVAMTNGTTSMTFVDAGPTAINGRNFGLNGYLDVSAPNIDPPPVMPTLAYWGFPLSEANAVLATSFPVFSRLEMNSLLGSAGDGNAVADGAGQIGAVALDCIGNQAPGVVVVATTASGAILRPYYFRAMSMLVQSDATDRDGLVLFANVPPGTVTLTATPSGFDAPVSTERVFVRAGAVTEVGLAPTPAP
jgi:hypothetical protein